VLKRQKNNNKTCLLLSPIAFCDAALPPSLSSVSLSGLQIPDPPPSQFGFDPPPMSSSTLVTQLEETLPGG